MVLEMTAGKETFIYMLITAGTQAFHCLISVLHKVPCTQAPHVFFKGQGAMQIGVSL